MVSMKTVSMSAAMSLFAGLYGCSLFASGSEGGAAATAEEEGKTKKAFVVREADLPKGFPAPSAVGKIVVKEYPAYRLARTTAGKAGGPNAMFNPLFNHIKRNDIPMTAPVEMEYSATAADGGEKDTARPRAESMAFLYGEPTWGRPGADAGDARVVVEDVAPMTVVSLAVRGDYNERNFAAGLRKLKAWLETGGGEYRVVGAPRYLAYNSPFVPGFLKLGEIQLPVEKIHPATTRPADADAK